MCRFQRAQNRESDLMLAERSLMESADQVVQHAAFLANWDSSDYHAPLRDCIHGWYLTRGFTRFPRRL